MNAHQPVVPRVGESGLDTFARVARPVPADGGDLASTLRELVEEAILDGRLAAGTRVNATALAVRLGVSHIPVREALRALGADGWIDFRPNAGAFVRQRSEHELIDLFETRLILEVESARLAADRRSSDQVDALDALLELQASATEPTALARLNARFHVLVAECSQNDVHAEFVRVLAMRTRFYFIGVVSIRRQPSISDHSALVDALRRRDADASAEIARAHITETYARVLDSLSSR